MSISDYVQNVKRKRIAAQVAKDIDYSHELHIQLEAELKKHECYLLESLVEQAQADLDKIGMIDIRAAGIAYLIKKYKARIAAIEAE